MFERLYASKIPSIITPVNVDQDSKKIFMENVKISMNVEPPSMIVAIIHGVPIP